jgi:hypothetical protein
MYPRPGGPGIFALSHFLTENRFPPRLREGRLFLIVLQAQANAVANRIFIPVELALMDTDNREPKS